MTRGSMGHRRDAGGPVAAHRGGFTLAELLCALAVAGIAIAVGVPHFQRLVAARTVGAQVDAFESALRYARSEAVRRVQPVTICIARQPEEAAPDCAASAAGGWQSGWLVFIDHGEIGRIERGDTLLRVEQPPRITARINSSRRALTFEATGIALSGTGSYRFLPPGAIGDDDPLARTVCVNKQGRARVAGPGGCA